MLECSVDTATMALIKTSKYSLKLELLDMRNTSFYTPGIKMHSTLTLTTCCSLCLLITGSTSLYQLHMAAMLEHVSLPLAIDKDTEYTTHL